jgi:hypothetical protein
LLAGQAVFAAMLTAAFGIQVRAQEFRIEDVTAPAGLAVTALKPKSIAFLDRPSDELIDPDAGLVRFEDWAQARPLEKQFLTPFPSYAEPPSRLSSTACASASRKLHVCGRGTLVLARAPGLMISPAW